MVIGIIGYFTVPSIANYIVHAGGANALLYKATNMFSTGANSTASNVVASAGSIVNPSGSGRMSSDSSHNGSGYMHEKLAGNKT